MDLKLPNLGEGADSGTVVNLFIKEGDQITKDQPVLELENEKAVATIPSTAAGKVTKIYVRPGEKITVGQNILSLSEDSQPEPAKARPEAGAKEPTPKPPEAAPEQHSQPPTEAQPWPPTSELGPAASPSIRKFARDLGIDLSRVRGTERGGRISMADLRGYIQRLQGSAASQQARPGQPGAPAAEPHKPEQIDFSKWGPVTTQPLSPLRQVIARRMAESWTAIPRVTQFDEADITALNQLRKKYAPTYEAKGARLTLTSFALRAVVDTLKSHQVFNSSLDDSGKQLILKQYFHIGIAVDTEAGLMVPVIRDVDKKDMFKLSQELETLAKKARERKVSADELKGGTFTISNQGGIGSAHFTPIVNKPEVAILGLGRGVMKPVVREHKIEPRLLLPLALSYDHRVIDGGAAARFIVALVKAFENFNEQDVNVLPR